MAIYRLLKNSRWNPDEISCLTTAYDETLKALGLKDRNDPLTEFVARKIIEVAENGLSDPAMLSGIAMKELGWLAKA